MSRSSMSRQEVVWKVADRLTNLLYNELDYYMFEELGFTETNDEYVEEADKLAYEVLKELIN
tara:strand:+ start:351 stop:536 length:186 start_codon:yes stop_codon:yes gene_type:complete